MSMFMGSTADKMLHIPVMNSKNTGTKENFCLASSCDIYWESEDL